MYLPSRTYPNASMAARDTTIDTGGRKSTWHNRMDEQKFACMVATTCRSLRPLHVECIDFLCADVTLHQRRAIIGKSRPGTEWPLAQILADVP
jgi:hypothetical protein